MTTTATQRLHEVLDRFQAKDVEGVVECFAGDGHFFDPHYPAPVGPAMVGHDAIRQGLSWGLSMVEQPGFAVRHDLSAGDGDRVAAVEVDTSHRLADGTVMAFPQVFVAEVGDDGLLRRMQAYTPYPPPAMP